MVLVKQYTSRPNSIQREKAIPVVELPAEITINPTIDINVIENVRSQPKPNKILDVCKTRFKRELGCMIALMGSYCNKGSVDNIYYVVEKIHSILNQVHPAIVKGWIRLITGLHPYIDQKLNNLGYWKTLNSEQMGLNTLLYRRDWSSTNVGSWNQSPQTNNAVNDSLASSISFIKETTRHKLDSSVVELMQGANNVTTNYIRRNLIYESVAGEISKGTNHGTSLRCDTFHYDRVKESYDKCKGSITDKLREQGYYVDYLVNHLTPIRDNGKAQISDVSFEGDMEIEGEPLVTTNVCQPVVYIENNVNNNILKPEIIEI